MRQHIVTSVALCASVVCVQADEGMWRLDQLPREQIRETYGLSLSDDALKRVQASAVRILSGGGGGGTGTFASAHGLILTNHHVALDCIRTSSLAESMGAGGADNLVEQGFTAANVADEVPCKRFVVQLERQARDVTAEMDSVEADGMVAGAIQAARQSKRSQLERDCREQRGENFSCSVEEFNSGATSLLISYEEFRDIRLVYAPEKQLGYFGGDEMNFRFPRYVSDISILRAYQGPAGEHTDYARENVPAATGDFLPVSFDGVSDGDPTFVAGFPGNTNRYRMSFSADYNLRKGIPDQIEDIDTEMVLVRRFASMSEENQLILQNRIFGMSNTRKYLMDVLAALRASDIVADRRKREEDFLAFLATEAEHNRLYADVIDLQRAVYRDDVAANAKLDAALGWLSRSRVFGYAVGLYEFAVERAKTRDEDREPQFQERNWDRMGQALASDDPVLIDLEEEFLAIGFEKLVALSADERPDGLDLWFGRVSQPDDPRALARAVTRDTELQESSARRRLLEAETSRFETSEDSAIQFARVMLPLMKDRRSRVRVLNQKLFSNRARFARGVAAWKKESLYPDANFTLRFSFGRVAGFDDRRGVAVPFTTTFDGLWKLAAERDGEADFALPRSLTDWKASLGDGFDTYADLAVNFVSTNDITGGNSGSALLNGKLQIVGLIFDGNEDGTASDWIYNGRSGRAISTDIRFALTLAEKVHDGGWIVEELRNPAKSLASSP